MKRRNLMNKKPLLIVMVGIPGSGKSTIAEEIKNTYNFKIFSSDEIRKELLGCANDQSNNYYVFKTLYERLKDNLTNGQNCIFDATNVSIGDRKGVFKKLKDVEFDAIAYVVATNVEEAIHRNSLRDRKVPLEDIQKIINKFVMPSVEEGFKDVIINNSRSEILRFKSIIENTEISNNDNYEEVIH
jgi:predicted kinase